MKAKIFLNKSLTGSSHTFTMGTRKKSHWLSVLR